jgi:diguanylate cyclase (GGDEF)-like protein
MAWYIGVIAVLALALACDLYLRGRAIRRARAQARVDELVRIESPQAFYEVAEREFERARRYGHPFTLAYFDLDDFTEVSNRFGPQVAEAMRRLVAEAARRAIRSSDVVARLAGDAFALLLPETGPEAVDAVIRKLQDALRDTEDDTALPVTISGGVVTCLQPAESLEAVIGAADRLLSGVKGTAQDTFWREVIAPQPLETFEPARLRRPFRLPPTFDVPMPPPFSRDRGH